MLRNYVGQSVYRGDVKKPQIPPDEKARLEALESLGLLYSPSEERFDRITALACKVFDVPIALVSLIADQCQWFKSAQGLSAAETAREISFCGHAILSEGALVVPDATADPRFADNPLVTGAPNIRFYAGHPVEYQGKKLGTLCLIDDKPRPFSTSDREDLKSMALWVQNEINVTALSEVQLELLKELGAAKRQNMIDPITKTWNLNGLDDLLKKEFSRSRREQSSVSIVTLKIDNFGHVSQECGSHAADLVLMELAQRIRATIRPQDLLGRRGEDEFQIYLGDCFTNRAAGIAHRIITRVNEQPVEVDDYSGTITASIGIASLANAEDADLESLLKLSEKALDKARKEGGNRLSILNYPSGD